MKDKFAVSMFGQKRLKSKKVSIIVPVHNAEKTLDVCISSILEQDYDNIECILVENNSSDCSSAICSKYAEKYNNVSAVSITETGVSNARNKGMDMVTGDIIGFCDADDFLEPGAIKTIVQAFQNDSDVDAVFCGFNIGIKQKNNGISKKYRGLKEKKISVKKALQLAIINDSIMGSVWNKYYKAENLKNLCFDSTLDFCEDMHFNAQLLSAMKSNRKVKIVSEPVYCYMENPDSATHNEEILFDENSELKYIVALKAIMRDCCIDKATLSMIKMRIACFCIDFLTCMEIDEAKKCNLEKMLCENYRYLLLNWFRNNWKWNLKRICRGWIFLRKIKNSDLH